MSSSLDTPWKIQNHLVRLLTLPWMRAQFFLAGVSWPAGAQVFGSPIIQRHRRSRIELGENISLRSSPRSNPLSPPHPVVLSTREPGSKIIIGRDCGLTGATVVAAESITIGDRVLVGSGATITDTDFHPLSPESRKQDINDGRKKPVIIENDVFIGMNAIILKGVRLGAGCVVGAGSVVSRDVPARAIVAGNPARAIGQVNIE